MKDWVVRPVFEEKTKPHVTEMLCSVLEMRDTGEEPEQVQVPDLPKNIAPIPRPPKEDLLARHVSRFGKKLSKMALAFTLSVFYFWNRLLKVF